MVSISQTVERISCLYLYSFCKIHCSSLGPKSLLRTFYFWELCALPASFVSGIHEGNQYDRKGGNFNGCRPSGNLLKSFTIALFWTKSFVAIVAKGDSPSKSVSYPISAEPGEWLIYIIKCLYITSYWVWLTDISIGVTESIFTLDDIANKMHTSECGLAIARCWTDELHPFVFIP